MCRVRFSPHLSTGYFNISMEGISVTWGIEGRIQDDRWVIQHFHVYPEVQQMKVYFTDLFNGNQDMSEFCLRLYLNFHNISIDRSTLISSVMPMICMNLYYIWIYIRTIISDKVALNFVNEYWPVLYKGMLPTVEKHWDYHLTDFVNRLVFSKISASKTFPWIISTRQLSNAQRIIDFHQKKEKTRR